MILGHGVPARDRTRQDEHRLLPAREPAGLADQHPAGVRRPGHQPEPAGVTAHQGGPRRLLLRDRLRGARRRRAGRRRAAKPAREAGRRQVPRLVPTSGSRRRRTRPPERRRKGLARGDRLGRGAAGEDRAERRRVAPVAHPDGSRIYSVLAWRTGLAQEATRETFANLPTWAVAFWYFLIFLSTGILFYGIYRLAQKYRQGRGSAELGPAGPASRADVEDRPLPLVDPPTRPAVGLRAPVRLLRLHGALRRNGDPRLPGRRRRKARVRVLEGLVLRGVLALPRRLRCDAGRRADRAGREARDHAAVSPRLLAARPRARRARLEPGALRPRRLAVPRPALLPGPVRLPARGVPDCRDEPALREVVADRLGRRVRASATSDSRAARPRRPTTSTGGSTASSRSGSSPRSRSRRQST